MTAEVELNASFESRVMCGSVTAGEERDLRNARLYLTDVNNGSVKVL